jgi:sugar porter (SP) family MFS transporter
MVSFLPPANQAPSEHKNVIGGREFPQVTWYKDPQLRKLYAISLILIISQATNGFDGSMMNGLQSLVYWQNYFSHPDGPHLGLLNAIQSVGAVVAIPTVPYFSDGIGRKYTIIIGCILMFIGIALQSAAVNIGMFIAARFMIGFGVSYSTQASPLLIAELAHPQHRIVITSIYGTTYYLGSIIASWTTFGTLKIPSNWAWRAPSLLQAAPSVIQLSLIWLVPESPRYLISRGKEAQAKAILTRFHESSSGPEFVTAEFDEICETIELEKEFSKRGWSELWATPGNRYRSAICILLGFFSQWSGNALVSYYISKVLNSIGITNETTQLEINGGLAIWNMITAVSITFFIDKFGRRPLFLTSVGGMLVTFIAWTVCSSQFALHGNNQAATAVVAMIFIYYFFYNLSMSGLLAGYIVEILPYNIRAKGFALNAICINGALFFNNYVNPIALDNIAWKYYIVYCCILAAELVIVYILWVETKNTTLEEVAVYFDGEDARVSGGMLAMQSRKMGEEKGVINADVTTVHVD